MRACAGAFVSLTCSTPVCPAGVTNITVMESYALISPPRGAPAAAARPTRRRTAGHCFASVTEPEEELFLTAACAILAAPNPPLIVMIPRAPERFDAFSQAIVRAGLKVQRRSDVLDCSFNPTQSISMDVLLGDSLGEMYFYLGFADRVVVGGGFQPKGSHNIIEPLTLGCPVIVGPYIQTIEYPATEALAAGVCCQTTAERLAETVMQWLDPNRSFQRPFRGRGHFNGHFSS
jgi:3-deoxy-D-manno-octulosonic-acid transferase